MTSRQFRLNVFIEREHARRLAALSKTRRLSKSSLVAAAISWYLTPDGGESRQRALFNRLNRIAADLERLERDQTILLETLALFVRHQLAISPPIAERDLAASRAQGRVRFQQFIDQLARHLQGGQSTARDVLRQMSPESFEEGTVDHAADEATGSDEGTGLDELGPLHGTPL